MSGWCLDSWALLRWLDGVEPAATRVEAIIATRPTMSWINLGEVFYVTARAAGSDVAEDIVREMRHRLQLEQPTAERVMQAARIKADYPMAYADAFAIATAMARGAVLLTGDPEILDAVGPWSTEDLRP